MKIIRLDSTDSTNKHAERLLSEKILNESFCLVSEYQTEGKGLDDNNWVSEPGKNLMISIVNFPDFLPAEQQFALNKIASLSVAMSIKKFIKGYDIFVKWPNDVYIKNKKVCGILLRCAIQSGIIKHCISGIGINIHQDTFPENIPNAASLMHYSEKPIKKNIFLDELLDQYKRLYHLLSTGNIQKIDADYLKMLYKMDEVSDFVYKGSLIKATIRGVNEYGWLRIETPEGSFIECNMKEISYII